MDKRLRGVLTCAKPRFTLKALKTENITLIGWGGGRGVSSLN